MQRRQGAITYMGFAERERLFRSTKHIKTDAPPPPKKNAETIVLKFK